MRRKARTGNKNEKEEKESEKHKRRETNERITKRNNEIYVQRERKVIEMKRGHREVVGSE